MPSETRQLADAQGDREQQQPDVEPEQRRAGAESAIHDQGGRQVEPQQGQRRGDQPRNTA